MWLKITGGWLYMVTPSNARFWTFSLYHLVTQGLKLCIAKVRNWFETFCITQGLKLLYHQVTQGLKLVLPIDTRFETFVSPSDTRFETCITNWHKVWNFVSLSDARFETLYHLGLKLFVVQKHSVSPSYARFETFCITEWCKVWKYFLYHQVIQGTFCITRTEWCRVCITKWHKVWNFLYHWVCNHL